MRTPPFVLSLSSSPTPFVSILLSSLSFHPHSSPFSIASPLHFLFPLLSPYFALLHSLSLLCFILHFIYLTCLEFLPRPSFFIIAAVIFLHIFPTDLYITLLFIHLLSVFLIVLTRLCVYACVWMWMDGCGCMCMVVVGEQWWPCNISSYWWWWWWWFWVWQQQWQRWLWWCWW